MLLFLVTLLFAQQDQTPRQPQKDTRGLLKIDTTYFDLAANTGGDFYFWAPGEFAASSLQVPVHREAVLLSYGAVESKKTFDIPVESGAQELTLFAGVQRKDLAVLIRPDGTVVRDFQSFQHMVIATVKSPATGIWHLELQGAGTYAVTAHVKPSADGPELIKFDFIEPGGRPGHEGMFPVKRAVQAGESLACEVALSGSAKEAELLLVARDASVIGVVPITRSSPGEYTGRCTVPEVPYRVAIRGVDSNGAAFQRVESPLHTPEKKRN